MTPEFLTYDTVLEIHEASLARFGGLRGVRSWDLLESALGQPRATFGGVFLHDDVFVMAAAYLFHVVKNHPFADGNKRAGMGAALAFLDGNGFSIGRPSPRLYEATMAAAEGTMDKAGLARLFRELAASGGRGV